MPSSSPSSPVPLLTEGSWPPGNSFVLPEHKMVYISTTKVACSSLRWMLADLAGENFSRFYRASGDHQTRLMTIHASRSVWQRVPQIKNLAPKTVADISRDNGWLIFAAVRDPWSRLWSAWQSKFLVRHASYVANYGKQPWFPRVPKQPEDILADWYAFVAARPWETHRKLQQDAHFKPQVESVHPEAVNYSRIYDLREMSQLYADVHEHLAGIGKDKKLYTPSANESAVLMVPQVLENGVAAAIEDSYQRDFEAFGHFWNLDKVRTSDVPWSMDGVRAITYHGLANQRIGDMSAELKTARDEMRKATARANAAETELRSRRAEALPLPPAGRSAVLKARAGVRALRRRVDQRRSGR